MAAVESQGFNASADRVRAILESERAKGKEMSRMVVGGFSQGGAVALHVCLRSTQPLAGIVWYLVCCMLYLAVVFQPLLLRLVSVLVLLCVYSDTDTGSQNNSYSSLFISY